MHRIYVGYDEREAIAYHTFCNSVITTATQPLRFTPLARNTLNITGPLDGSNAFTYSRFLVPFLNDYEGWALFVDGDMLCKADIAELFQYADDSKAVCVVKHNYQTKYPIKYLGNKNEDYPRKNWSSVILWNCGHPKNKVLSPDYIAQASGKHLHRFEWLADEDIGEIKKCWNWLAMEMPHNPSAKLVHYTVGIPAFPECADGDHADEWHKEFEKTITPNCTNR
jgi:lipopolysaccharide biosynthesis glycosyltransferase